MFLLNTNKVLHRPDWYLFTSIFRKQRGCLAYKPFFWFE